MLRLIRIIGSVPRAAVLCAFTTMSPTNKTILAHKRSCGHQSSCKENGLYNVGKHERHGKLGLSSWELQKSLSNRIFQYHYFHPGKE